MDTCEVGLDGIEAQRPTDVSRDQRKGRFFPINLILKLCSRAGSMPPIGDTESRTEFLTNLTLLDLYNVPDESLVMNSEVFCAMRHGNIEFLEKMKIWEKTMACFKNDKGDSVLHIAAAFGHVELVKGIISICPCLLLLTNLKNQVPLHLAARSGHLAVVEALVASVTFFAAQVSIEEDRDRLNVYVLKDEMGDTPLHLALQDLHEKQESLLNQHRPTFPLSSLIMHLHSIKSSSLPDASTRLMETALCLVNANQGASFLANKKNRSPLYLAVEAGNLTLVNAMLNRSGNNVQGLTSELEGTKSLVHAALKAKKKGLFPNLIDQISLLEEFNRSSYLFVIDVLDVILNEYPTFVKERDEDRRTCLWVGVSVGFKEGVCKVLDSSTLSVFECDEDGSFPIHMAVEKGHDDVVMAILIRFPDSIEQLNKQGQNILHIAAKSGKASASILNSIRGFDMKNRLIEEQDVDGNTPLHLATIYWRPQKVWGLTTLVSTKTKVLNTRNACGLRALDIAETRMQHDYVVRERMTLMVLLGVYKPKAVSWIPISGMTLKSRLKKPRGCDQTKERINILLVVAALVATMTFAAGFTMPGGFISSDPNSGMAILINEILLEQFLFSDTVAMYSSVVAILALIWAQLGDEELAHKAFHLALPALFLALCAMSFAFYYGVLATTIPNRSIRISINIIFVIFSEFLFCLIIPYVLLQFSGIPFIDELTSNTLGLILLFINDNDAEEDSTSGSLDKKESVVSSSGVQVEKSKDV